MTSQNRHENHNQERKRPEEFEAPRKSFDQGGERAARESMPDDTVAELPDGTEGDVVGAV